MIVVIGSRHDPVAKDLTGSWADAALCSAEDFIQPGWVWPLGKPARETRARGQSRTWVIAGNKVDDRTLTGIFLRRSAFYPDELTAIHSDDRAYLANEVQAFLACVLATTAARVVNPVVDGAFGEEALRPDQWAAAADEAGLAMHPVRMSSAPQQSSARQVTHTVEVVGGDVLGDAPARVRKGAARLAASLGLSWGAFLFDQQQRLITVSASRPPGPAAIEALGALLGGKASRA